MQRKEIHSIIQRSRSFLHADMNDNVHMLLEGTIAEMIPKLDPTIYRIHPIYEKFRQRYYSGNYH